MTDDEYFELIRGRDSLVKQIDAADDELWEMRLRLGRMNNAIAAHRLRMQSGVRSGSVTDPTGDKP